LLADIQQTTQVGVKQLVSAKKRKQREVNMLIASEQLFAMATGLARSGIGCKAGKVNST
jgi:transketolase C-terminal domain/subunit